MSIIISIISVLLVCVFLFLVWQLSKQGKQISTQHQELKELQLLFVTIQQKIDDLLQKDKKHQQDKLQTTQTITQIQQQYDQKLNALTQRIEQLNASVDILNNQQPEDKLYTRAYKLAELGAGIEEIAQSCEIPIAEAEMLLAVHKNKISAK